MGVEEDVVGVCVMEEEGVIRVVVCCVFCQWREFEREREIWLIVVCCVLL